MTAVIDPTGITRYCSNANYDLTDVVGPGQDPDSHLDDAEIETGGTEEPTLGVQDEEYSISTIAGGEAALADTTIAAVPHCGRNSYESGGLVDANGVPLPGFTSIWTFRVKYSRSGRTKAGDQFRQYHIHWQIRKPFASNTNALG